MTTSVSKQQRELAGLLLAGVLAGALTGCGVRQRRQDAAATCFSPPAAPLMTKNQA